MAQAQKKQSGMPVAIILLVLILVVFIGWWFYNSSKTDSGPRPAPSPKLSPTPVDMSKAPLGAQPPNMLGSPTASVTVEEFADFQCPSCGDKHPVMKEIQQIYGNRIKFIFRNFPLQMHDKAYDAAVAAEAAGIQGRFWDMQNLLYTNQKSWASDPTYREVFKGYAKQIGLDVDKFTSDMAGLQTKNRIDADMQRGRALNVNSTPSVYVNGKLLPYESMTVPMMRQFIDSELQSANAASKPAAPANNSNSN